MSLESNAFPKAAVEPKARKNSSKSKVPYIKNIFAGNMKQDSDHVPPEPKDDSIFQYVAATDDSKNNAKRSSPRARKTPSKRARDEEDEDPFGDLDRDKQLQYRVAILMAMHSRRSNRSEFTTPAPENKMITVGFQWEHFPECEQILEESASEYFSAYYQRLGPVEMRRMNDAIVDRVQKTIAQYHYEVHPDFDNGKLRERIRCYYKTLIANAKKRLVTLEKRRDSDENQAYIKIFIRCARDPNLPLRRSIEMATLTKEFKRRRMSKIDQLRRQVIENSITF